VVLLDNGRSQMLGGALHDMLRCIRSGPCLNHCPVYSAVGGHAYGWFYPRPMGSVLTPQLLGLEEAGDLPNASTLCGRCEEVCPMSIPLPSLLRQHRVRQHRDGLGHKRARWALAAWAALVRRPALYHRLTGLAARLLARLGGRRGRLKRLPLAAPWISVRDLPTPEGRTFLQQWQAGKRRENL
jgi:L-lactate dehydrogenase complex protein LldF